MISEDLLSKWEKQCTSAWEGPWRVSKIKNDKFPDGIISLRGKDDVEICVPVAEEDARFMATAREAMPMLIVEVRRLNKVIAGMTREQVAQKLPTKEDILNGDFDGSIICPKLIDEDDEYINNDIYVCTFACGSCYMRDECPSLNDIVNTVSE